MAAPARPKFSRYVWPRPQTTVLLLLAVVVGLVGLAAADGFGTGAAQDDDDFYHTDTAECDRLAPYVRRVNGLGIAQSAVGAVGLALCGVAALHIVARSRDTRSLAARLVLGVLLTNLVYAVTDVLPVNLNQVKSIKP